MTLPGLAQLIEALNSAGVQYIVIGGIAVLAHGYARTTHDLDIVLEMSPANIGRAIDVLESLQYTPTVPVKLRDFLDPDKRASWARDKGMVVFSATSRNHSNPTVDLFVDPPFNVLHELEQIEELHLGPGPKLPIVSLSTLLEMKRQTGRPLDLADIEGLRNLHTRPEAN